MDLRGRREAGRTWSERDLVLVHISLVGEMAFVSTSAWHSLVDRGAKELAVLGVKVLALVIVALASVGARGRASGRVGKLAVGMAAFHSGKAWLEIAIEESRLGRLAGSFNLSRFFQAL
jgi:hypothetical protein